MLGLVVAHVRIGVAPRGVAPMALVPVAQQVHHPVFGVPPKAQHEHSARKGAGAGIDDRFGVIKIKIVVYLDFLALFTCPGRKHFFSSW